MELMKNGLAKPAIIRLSCALKAVIIDFPEEKFIKFCLTDLDKLELKQRVSHFIEVIHQFMPEDFSQAAPLLIKLKKHWDYGDKEDVLRSFAAWPVVDYVAEYGLDHAETSLNVLKELTGLFSAEFAIRPFIIKYPELCQQKLLTWAKDESDDIRRLVSEGTRPRLPWGVQLKCFVEDPTNTLVLLNLLKNDPSLYIRRSVANHLNDISKDHPSLVTNTCKIWLENHDKNNSRKNLDWLIKHATRSLIKANFLEAFTLLGFTEKPKVSLSLLALSSQKISVGDKVNFSFDLESKTENAQKLVVDYIIHFVKANGEQRGKVFKLKNITLKANEKITLSKSHSFKKISTRKYYTGEHAIEIVVNGKVMGKNSLILTS
jgi:3-methyladenine DNA glycosylase AlkC